MRDRLIEIVDKAKEEYANDVTDHTETEYIVESLLNNGVVVPPCKVGDRMYCDGELFADHCKGEIMSFPVDIILTEVCSTHRGEIDMVFDFKRFGKDVFLTREEAEAKLKGGVEG